MMVLVRRYGLKLESEFAAVIISMGVLEGVARGLNPQIDLGMHSAPPPPLIRSYPSYTLSRYLACWIFSSLV